MVTNLHALSVVIQISHRQFMLLGNRLIFIFCCKSLLVGIFNFHSFHHFTHKYPECKSSKHDQNSKETVKAVQVPEDVFM